MIAVVEDDAGIRDIEIYTLKSTGFQAEGFVDGKEFLKSLDQQMPELLILDIMLPEQDGMQILQQLRQDPRTRKLPVILATAKGSEYDKVTGLDTGADDYLVKPFGMMEMVSRVRAVLRRYSSHEPELLKQFGIELDSGSHTVKSDGERCILTLKEYEMLYLFLKRPGQVLTREQLLNEIWGIDYDGETRTVDVHIRTLRTKLGRQGMHIETVRGFGYRLEAEQ